MPPLFSIIIPVYRSGPFLRDCLDSIRNQTLTDWECICINDGSPDDSGAILDEYARKDARFTAIHQDNRGVSAARNAGLSVARGNWTAFVDGDDTVEPDMLACLHEEALRAQEAALLCYGISKDFHAGSRLIRTETTLPSRNQHIPAGETGAFLRYLLTSLDMESSCNKLFRTELLKKNGILFNTSAVVFEDFQFVLDYLSACAPDIILLKKAFYHYRAQETENGAAKRSRFNLVRDIDALTTKFLAWASTLSLPQEDIPIVKGYILQKISVIFHALQRQPYAARREVFRDFLSSGLAARKAEVDNLSAQLAGHTLARTYECIVVGNLREDSGTVDAPIARDSRDRKRMAVIPGGRRAVTHWEVIARYPGYTHVRCRLETGRTHQIRVHMAYLGHPILGDTVYGAKKAVPGLTGQCLHAVGLQFIHPRTKELVSLTCPLPEEFTAMLRKIDR